MTAFVLDSSITLAWFMPDEQSTATGALLTRVEKHGAVVPGLWRLEIGNILLMAQRHKRISAAQRAKALVVLNGLPISDDLETSEHAWTDTITLAEKYGLTLYDAAYVELARRRELALASLDRAMRLAAQALGIEVLGA